MFLCMPHKIFINKLSDLTMNLFTNPDITMTYLPNFLKEYSTISSGNITNLLSEP